MAASATKLLKEIEPLPVSARRHAMAATALRLRGTPELTGLLADLSERGHYEQVLALHLAAVADEREFLLSRLDAESPELAARAMNALIRSEIELETLVDRLPRMSFRTRRALYRALRRAKGAYVADPLLPEIRRRYGDGEAARMLPYCSESTVAEYLPELAYCLPDWTALGRRHLGVVLAHAEELAAQDGESEWRDLWPRVGACARTAAEHHPDRLLALAAQAIRYCPIQQLQPVGGQLARHDPDAVRALVLHPSGRGASLTGSALWQALRELPDEHLISLCSVYPPYAQTGFVQALPPARRAAVVRAVFARPGLAPAQFDAQILDLLPWRARAELARELLGRPGADAIRWIREALTARLPWDEAEPVLAAAIRRPTADERTAAYPLLITAAFGARDPQVLTALLVTLRRLRNEQEPVRAQAFHTLGTVPPTLLRAEHLPTLEQLCADALQARDRSRPTIFGVATLARVLLVRAVTPTATENSFLETAQRLLELLAAHATEVPLGGIHRNLPRGAEQRLFEALRRRLDNDAARDEWDLALALASGLDKRAWNVPDLERLVLRAAGAGNDTTVRHAVDLALRNPATRDQHLMTLLKRDRSVITLPAVQRVIGSRRTDLLESLLGAATPGRFLSAKVRFVPTFSSGFGSWTAHQVERYAHLLSAHADHQKSSVWEKRWAVRQLGRLPDTFDRLVNYVEHPELSVSEAALTALGRSEQPERALVVLAAHVGSDRARVAVSSIATCAKGIAPDRLAAATAALLNSPKITANKEGLRLLAELHAPEAMATIQEVWQRPNQHRDVRRAAVFACRFLLDQSPAWQLLAEAATDPAVAGEITDLAPRLFPVEQRRRLAALILVAARSTDTPLASQAISALPTWSRWSPPETGAELARRVCELDELGLWHTAVPALVLFVTATGDPAPLHTAVGLLLAADGTELPGRDLPARQRLATLISRLTMQARVSPAARNAAGAIAATLGAEPLWREAAITLHMAGIHWNEPESAIAAIRRAGNLADGLLVDRPARHVDRALSSANMRAHTPATLHTVALALIESSDLATVYAALTLTGMCGKHFGWSPDWVELLHRMRAHNKIDIRAAASAEFTIAE
ncbi:hypothetical protein AB0H76_05525 [Nocardia sp. NPDC050712]|uniref:hypothetical protein n=1 Tax=Nocardia sp. NPDC050712 TaxID=3155518 RepID=UPI00340C408E